MAKPYKNFISNCICVSNMFYTIKGGGFQPARSAAGRSNLSEGDTDDSDGMGEFSLIKLAGKSKQQKKVS